MNTQLDAQGQSLRLDLADAEAARAFFDQAAAREGFFLVLDRELPQFQRLKAEACCHPGVRFPFEAEVMQIFPQGAGFGTAFRLVDWTPARRKELDLQLDGGESTEASVSPTFRIRHMNPMERFRLATRASRTERQILLRDTSSQVLMGLLTHPRLEDKEVLAIVKSPHCNSGILKRVAENRKWMMNPDVRTAVVRSPKTPTLLATRLLDKLPTDDLRYLSKIGNAREPLRRAALRVYLKRTGSGR